MGQTPGTRAWIGYRELSNGFAATDDPAGLQAICDRLGPATIEAFVERWLTVVSLPLTEHDRTASYWWELSMRQVEVSRTIVFTQPRCPVVLRGIGLRQPRHRPRNRSS